MGRSSQGITLEFGRKVHFLILNNIKEKAYGIESDIKKAAYAGELTGN